MPLLLALICVAFSLYLLLSNYYILAGIGLLFSLGLFINARPKRKIDFKDLVPSQHTSNQNRKR